MAVAEKEQQAPQQNITVNIQTPRAGEPDMSLCESKRKGGEYLIPVRGQKGQFRRVDAHGREIK